MGQPMRPYAPHDEEPAGALQPLMALGLPTLGTQRLPMRSRGLPSWLPLAIAHRIAQHQHGVDVVPTPAHARPFEACFDDQLIGAFHAA